MSTRTFHFEHAPVRARVRGGEPVWFVRDVAAALGLRLPAAPLLPESPNSLPGIATAEQVWTLVRGAGCGAAPDAFRAWMERVSAQLAAAPARQPAPVPRPRHLTPVRRTHAA
ncbi:hypothetical protein ACFWRZ_08970 [Streptomyces rubiginosohelvolus]|uniref:hypothetical protein n=1 Tax=Streptomyces rubiginosohelvolus TaxID=67362 RepID=UPI0036577E63